jgi:deazaflavin-dependent oxidoreductase (nitroreductase family)
LPEDQFLCLDTTGWKSGRQHRIEIWFVERGEKYYVMSEGKEHAHWVQNIVHKPQVSYSVSDERFVGTARVIEGKDPVAAEIKKLMKKKYGWDQGLIVELAHG